MPWPPREKLNRSNTGTGCITVSSSWNPSARWPRTFSSRLTLQGDLFSSTIGLVILVRLAKAGPAKKRQHGNVGAASRQPLAGLVTIEYPEPVPRHEWRNTPPAETQVDVRRKHRVLHQHRRIIVRIDRARREVRSENRIVRWHWRGHHFIYSYSRSRQRPVDAPNKSHAVSRIGSVNERGLLHRPAEFAAPHDLERVAHAAAEFPFNVRAAAGQRAGHHYGCQEGKCVSHRFSFL